MPSNPRYSINKKSLQYRLKGFSLKGTSMGKEKERAKLAHIRAHVAEPYQKEIRRLKENLDAANAKARDLTSKNQSQEKQIQELEEKLAVLQGALARMQQYVKLSDEELEEVKKQIESSIRARKALNETSELFGLLNAII